MAEYEILDDNWSVSDHFNYVGCQENDNGLKYYVLFDGDGDFLATANSKDEILREASKRDIKLHMSVTVLPMKGIVRGSVNNKDAIRTGNVQ